MEDWETEDNSHLASKIEEIEDDSFIASHLDETTKDVLAFSLQDTPANHERKEITETAKHTDVTEQGQATAKHWAIYCKQGHSKALVLIFRLLSTSCGPCCGIPQVGVGGLVLQVVG